MELDIDDSLSTILPRISTLMAKYAYFGSWYIEEL